MKKRKKSSTNTRGNIMKDERFVVFDNKGIIHESPDEDETISAFKELEHWTGDLILAKIIARRR